MELEVTFETIITIVDKLMRDQRAMSDLSAAEKTFWLVWTFKAETDNGGLNQFFFNNCGDWAQETVDALNDVGASEIADLLQNAINLLPDRVVSPITRARRDTLKMVEPSLFKPIENLYYQRNDILNDLLITHIKKNMVATILPVFINEASAKADNEFRKKNYRGVVNLLSQYENHLQKTTLTRLIISRKKIENQEES